MWSIVNFDADNSVEPVPTHWLNKDKSKCAWPNNDSTADKLRNNRANPNELDFSYFSCRVMANNISSLANATKKVKLAMYTSELSDGEAKNTKTDNHLSEKKRNVISSSNNNSSKQPTLFDDSDVDKNYELHEDCSKKSILNYDSENDDTFTATKSTLNKQDEKNSTLNITPISKKYGTQNKVVFQKGNISSSNAVTDTQNVPTSTSNHQESDIQNIQVSYLTSDATNTPASVSPLVNGNEQHLNFQKLILKYLTSLKVEVSNISDTQQEIIKMVNDIQNRTSTQVDDSWAHEVDYFVSSWPISDQDGLNDMENKIKNDFNFRKQVVSELARIGGKSLPNMINKILKKVFDDSILLEFTYYGLRNKDNFSSLAINKVIIEAVLKSKFKNHSNDEIITAISKWLTGAKGRISKK